MVLKCFSYVSLMKKIIWEGFLEFESCQMSNVKNLILIRPKKEK